MGDGDAGVGTGRYSWVVMPVHNAIHLTKTAVRSVLAQQITPPVRLLVINNASTDGTAEWLRTLQPRVETVNIYPQKGVAHAWNTGLRYLFEELGEERVLVVNNDVELRPDTYSTLDRDGGVFVTAVGSDDPKSIEPFDSAPLARQAISPRIVAVANKETGRYDLFTLPDYERRRPHPDFSCYLIRRSVWETVGPFDEEFKLAYCEDADMHLRMHDRGVDAYSIGVPFLHVDRGSGTIKSMGNEERDRLLEQADKNREYFKAKHGVAVGSPEYYARFQKRCDCMDCSIAGEPTH